VFCILLDLFCTKLAGEPKLGYWVSKRTVAKYMRQARKNLPPRSSGQTWATFIQNHAHDMWACDFVQSFDLFFGTIFLFFVIELGSRWVARQLREATPYGQKPRFLIRDNDSKYGQCFTRVARGTTIDVLRTPVRAPKANAICERFIGSVRRECLEHMLILGERHLHRLMGDYVSYFTDERPCQGAGLKLIREELVGGRCKQPTRERGRRVSELRLARKDTVKPTEVSFLVEVVGCSAR